MLDIESLSVEFRRYSGLMRRVSIPVISDVSLSLKRGEVLAMIGASGSGKSILAQAILGLLPRNAIASGQVVFEGRSLDTDERRALCNRGFALVPQSLFYLDPLARCGSQIAWSAQRADGESRLGRAGIEKKLAQFNLAPEVGNAFPHALSGGMARRILLSVTTAGKARLLIADEPTSGLDPENAAIVLSHLRALADDGHAILLITHDLAAALPFADRVAILKDGRIDCVTDAARFSVGEVGLPTPYARALWQAMPQNMFSNGLAHCA